MELLSLLETVPNPAWPNLAIVASDLAAGRMTPPHVHPADEALLVVDGALTVYCGPDATVLRAGRTLLLPAGVPHAIVAEAGGARIRTATFVRSAGRYEDFLRAVASGPLSEQDEATVGALAAANGIRLTGVLASAAAA